MRLGTGVHNLGAFSRTAARSPARALMGVPRRRFHELRHGCATLLQREASDRLAMLRAPRVRDLLRGMDGGDDPSPWKALQRARTDMEAGALWKARGRLQGLVRVWPADQQVLGMLGEVLFAMGDLPAAGLCWYLTEQSGADVDAARAAMQRRHGHGALELTRTLPVVAPIHAYPPPVQARPRAATEAVASPEAVGRRHRGGATHAGDGRLARGCDHRADGCRQAGRRGWRCGPSGDGALRPGGSTSLDMVA